MPGFDKTGPRGMGPMTGGGFGWYVRARARQYGRGGPGAWSGGWGRGGRMRGQGWGPGYWAWEPGSGPVPGDEPEAMEAEAAGLNSRLSLLESRLARLEKAAGVTEPDQ